MIEEIVSGVFVFPHEVVEGKNAIIFGSRAVLAIDACMWPHEAEGMVEFIEARGGRADYLAVTHGHPDHVFGSAPFRGGAVIAHEAHDAMVREVVARHASRVGGAFEDIFEEIAHPTETFNERLDLDLGDRMIQLIHTPGHTPDSVCAYLPDQRVLVGGDTVVTGIVPAIGDGDSETLERSLHLLAGLDIDALVPGHGPVIHGSESVRDWIQWAAHYLAAVRERVRSVSDADRVEFEAATAFAELVGERFSPEAHGMRSRHGAVVDKIAAEVSPRRRAGE